MIKVRARAQGRGPEALVYEPVDVPRGTWRGTYPSACRGLNSSTFDNEPASTRRRDCRHRGNEAARRRRSVGPA